MIGGGKAGNIISPNPNTIAVSEAFKVDLTSLMMKNFIPAICAVVVTILLSTMLSKKQGVQVTENDLEQLRAELAEQGYLRLLRRKGKPPKSLPPMEFTASDGTRILVGRNNRQNDQLTLKTANKNDIWLHTQNIPGSHVILETGGREPSQQVLEEAAQLAAYHSKARDSAQVPVDYCAVRYVKKPAGAKPGMVIFTNQHTLYVKPEQR